MNVIYHHRTRSTDAQRIHILEIVAALENLGHTVEIVSLVPTDAALDDAKRDAEDPWWKKLVRKIPFAYEVMQLGYNLVGIPMLFARVLARKADFIYERYSLFNFTGVLVAKLCRVPLILEVNSPFALEQSRDKEIRLRSFAQWTERVICNLATRVVVVSTPLARIMQSVGVSAEKLEVIPNGVRLERFQPQPPSPELRRKLGLSADQIVIGFVGWFRKWHGLEMLLEAFAQSGLANEGARVLLVGDGQAMADLQQFVDWNGLHDIVVFAGPVPHADVPPYLDLIDIAVQPAANEYCCPMKILEYMALGKPILAPRQENIQELLREGEEAEYFQPGDAASMAAGMKALVRDRARAQRIGAQARAAISSRGLLWEWNAARVVEMIADTTADHRPSSAGVARP
jgi:glycosyltransferase involved in cell wall biosynthesis